MFFLKIKVRVNVCIMCYEYSFFLRLCFLFLFKEDKKPCYDIEYMTCEYVYYRLLAVSDYSHAE